MIYRQNKAKTQKKLPNQEQPCLVCKTLHRHNQPFCSAKCCERYKSEHKK